jgi:uncharacterized membrane protein YgcG
MFSNNYNWSGIGFLNFLVVTVAVAIGIAMTHGEDQTPGLLLGLLIPLLFIMGGAASMFYGLQRESGGWPSLLGGSLVVGLFALGGLALMWVNARGVVDLVPGVAIFAAAATAGLSFRWLQAPSFEGRKVMDQIEGFRQYLGVAEEGRLEAMNPPDKTPELFERFLPYAIALDVENTWAKRFAGVLAAAGATAAIATWYSGYDSGSGNPVSFAEHLGSDLSSTIASASTAPGSSNGGGGSSGGGSSGGGGGGGGGSGW